MRTAPRGGGKPGAGTATGGAGGDTITADVENLTGSAFGDTLTGDADANAITGAGGDDDIQIRDSSTDAANCGTGTDSVTADANDTATGDCETVLRPSSGGGDPGAGGGGGGGTLRPRASRGCPAPSPPSLSALKAPTPAHGPRRHVLLSLDRAAAP